MCGRLSSRPCTLRSEKLELEADLHLVADQQAAGFERLIPGQTEIAAADLRRRAESEALAAPRIRDPALLDDVERHLTRHAVDRQVAGELELAAAAIEHARPLERDARILLRVEEVGRAEVRVALRVACVDGIDVD